MPSLSGPSTFWRHPIPLPPQLQGRAPNYIGEAWSEAAAGVHPLGAFDLPWTFFAWHQSRVQAPYTNLMCTQTNTSPVDYLNLRATQDGVIVRFVQSATRIRALEFGAPLRDGRWRCVAIVNDPSGSISAGTPLTLERMRTWVRVYVDGVPCSEIGTVDSTPADITSNLSPIATLRVGGCPLTEGGGPMFGPGLFDRALTLPEVYALRDTGVPAEVSGAYHWYRGEVTPGVLTDLGSRGLDLSPVTTGGGGGSGGSAPAGTIVNETVPLS